MAQLWQLSAAQLVEGYKTRLFTPIEALEACLERVLACEPHLNALVCVDASGAREAAAASTQRWSNGEPRSALDGVPITLKDNLHAKGLATTWGSRLLGGFVSPSDEMPVARLRSAGVVFFAKTNLPEFAMQGYTSNARFGITRNPWQRDLTPGGSSGGAAAAVAAGMGPIALATDGGGSIRRPASHCGLVGFKPSAGLVARRGGLPCMFLDYEVVGGIGRSVNDVATLIEILSQRPMTVPTLQRARILYIPQFGDTPVDRQIVDEVAAAARRFSMLGHDVEEQRRFASADDVNELWPKLSAVGLAWMLNDGDRWRKFGLSDDAHPKVDICGEAAQTVLREGSALHATDLFDLLARVEQLKGELDALFSCYDFLLTPATAALPWRAEQPFPSEIDGCPVRPRAHAVFTAFANAAGLPAIAIPSGFVGALPTGMQLVGKRGADAALLAMARQYEAAYPWIETYRNIRCEQVMPT